jgi:hypothetical protein
MDKIDGPSLGEIFRPAAWEKTRVEGAKELQRLLELPIPVVGVANGPATVRSEYLLVADIHIVGARELWRLPASRVPHHGRRRAARPLGRGRGDGAREVPALDR